MQVEGDLLVQILSRQTPPVSIWNGRGEVNPDCDPRHAATIAAAGGYVGFGSTGRNGRIRYLRPRGVQLRGDPFRTRPVRADDTCSKYGAGQLMGNPHALREFSLTSRR